MPNIFLENRYLVDRQTGERRFFPMRLFLAYMPRIRYHNTGKSSNTNLEFIVLFFFFQKIEGEGQVRLSSTSFNDWNYR